WRIRIMLRLQRQPVTKAVDAAAFAGDCAIEEVPGIELNARLRRVDLQSATSRGVGCSRGEHQCICRNATAVQHEVVIVTVAVTDLDVLSLIDARADWRRCPEVERRAGHQRDLPRGDWRGVDGGKGADLGRAK